MALTAEDFLVLIPVCCSCNWTKKYSQQSYLNLISTHVFNSIMLEQNVIDCWYFTAELTEHKAEIH